MNIKVLYHSSTGNTKKIAEAIAEELKVTAKTIEQSAADTAEPVDLLFIGDGVYFGKPNKTTAAFIERLSPSSIKNAAVFATYGGMASIGAKLKELLQSKGINVIGEPFTSKGKAWVVLNRQHPSKENLSKAREYAKNIAAQLNS